LQPESIAGEWRLFGGGEGEDLIGFARAADLVVYGQDSDEYRLPTGFDPQDLIVAAGRPVLVVPYAGAFATVGRRVLVAWDGSREAARAAHDALPLLGAAEAVTLLAVADGEAEFERGRPMLDRMLKNYERHGIPARAHETPQGDLSVSDVLLSWAADFGADLIVAGAYHHSQLRESLFGGVTRDLLDRMTVPVLMSH
jgi:nucleotide-binding universal stress UspA family protein